MRKTYEDSDQFETSCPPALTDRQRENQLIALAEDQAEKLLRSGKAPAAVITHYLKRATAKDKLEERKLEYEIELLKTKKEAIEAQERDAEAYKEVIKAMKMYNGHFEEDDDFDPVIFRGQ